MSFSDVFKKSFLAGYTNMDLGIKQIVVALLLTTILAIYIFFIYRILVKSTFYSKNFNVSLVAMAMITAAIILTIQSSIVVSLGMVGALSIVRFRTAIKDPMDLVFLFWAIGIGIICGAGLFGIALCLSLMLSVIILLLEIVPTVNPSKILLVSYLDEKNLEGKIIENIVKKYTLFYNEKSRCYRDGRTDLIYELRINNGMDLVDEIKKLNGLISVSMLKHDGEVTF